MPVSMPTRLRPRCRLQFNFDAIARSARISAPFGRTSRCASDTVAHAHWFRSNGRLRFPSNSDSRTNIDWSSGEGGSGAVVDCRPASIKVQIAIRIRCPLGHPQVSCIQLRDVPCDIAVSGVATGDRHLETRRVAGSGDESRRNARQDDEHT
jgi:hypothetical protein